jgi:cbb3-type cytochrome oxidase subunit 3
MRCKFVSLLIVLILVSLALPLGSEAQVVTSAMTITMGGLQHTTIVAGIIHNITLSISQASANVTLRAYFSGSIIIANNTNNYSWSYSSGVWADDLYGYYIKNESARYGTAYCFNIALDSTAWVGNWRFVTIVNGTEVSNNIIMVERPVAGLSMSAPTFYFQVVPYGTGFISSWKSNDVVNSSSLSTKNIGNVPMTFRITYETMNSLFTTTNSTGTSNPEEQRTHFISFQAQSWSPRKFTVKGKVNGEPQLLMTPNTVTTIVAAQTTFDVVVTVARPGYQIYQMDGVTVQYKSFYSSAYKQKLSLDMYLTGNKSVYLSQDVKNLTFNNYYNQVTQETTDDILFALRDDVEQQVVVNITCSSAPPWKQPSMITYANFNLSLSDNTGTGRFTSNVVVSSVPEENNEFPVPMNVFVIVILVIVFVAIALFMFRAYRKTEEEKRKELEEKIRRKKERARKQRRS